MRNPRNVLIALCVAAAASTLAVAGGHVHSSESDYVWSDDTQELVLHSNDHTGGVVIDRTRPSPLHGLRAGDVIVSVDGHAVANVDAVQKLLRQHTAGMAAIGVRRSGANVVLSWSPGEARLMFPEPPAPPAPPPPPPPAHG